MFDCINRSSLGDISICELRHDTARAERTRERINKKYLIVTKKNFKERHTTIMPEESKVDYVDMGGANMNGLDDPNLSPEDRDMKLAIQLQQQENAAVYAEHVKKHTNQVKADTNRTARSGTFSKLAAVRDKDHGALKTFEDSAATAATSNYIAPPEADLSPQELADHNLAAELQKVEQVGAGTVQTLDRMAREEQAAKEAQEHRTGRSKHTL